MSNLLFKFTTSKIIKVASWQVSKYCSGVLNGKRKAWSFEYKHLWEFYKLKCRIQMFSQWKFKCFNLKNGIFVKKPGCLQSQHSHKCEFTDSNFKILTVWWVGQPKMGFYAILLLIQPKTNDKNDILGCI